VEAHDRESVEALLRARSEALERTRASMRRSGQGMRETELADVDNHPADQGSELHEQEVDVTTEIFLEEEERRIAEARRALADGTYGTCVSCGKQIPAERLKAVPEAVRCIDCQRHFEGRHRQQTSA
jgi:RNA polymerase-binding transcription factor DksA